MGDKRKKTSTEICIRMADFPLSCVYLLNIGHVSLYIGQLFN